MYFKSYKELLELMSNFQSSIMEDLIIISEFHSKVSRFRDYIRQGWRTEPGDLGTGGGYRDYIWLREWGRKWG